jgi:hypothetical protein
MVVSHLRKDIQTFSATANSLVIFFSNNLMLIKKVLNYFMHKVAPHLSMIDSYTQGAQLLQNWCREVDYLTHPLNLNQVRGDPKLQYQIVMKTNLGEKLSSDYVHAGRKDPAFDVLMDRVRKLRKTVDVIAQDCVIAGNKFEPFVIHVTGAPNIGKSFMVPYLAAELLSKIEYKTYQQLVYVRTPGNEFWNNLAAQPVLHYDDFFFSKECGMLQCIELFNLKSSANFNPPQASL